MANTTTWRELLASILQEPGERERIAKEIGKHPLTLTRWCTGESKPRKDHLRQLLRAVPPDQRHLFETLVRQEDAEWRDEAIADLPPFLDADFLRGVWKMRAETPVPLLFWTLCKHVMQHALRQLDPQQAGLYLMVVQCMPPGRDGMIHSLREVFGRGTPPWPAELDREVMFLGAESLSGYVVSRLHPETVDDLRAAPTNLPHYKVGHEVSATAFPLLYANRVAGCLLVSSALPQFFSEARLQFVQDYASLIVEAFQPHQFYSLEQIHLQHMPPFEIQRALLMTLQDRIKGLMLSAQRAATHPLLTYAEAEQQTWQQLEEELLAAPVERQESASRHERR